MDMRSTIDFYSSNLHEKYVRADVLHPYIEECKFYDRLIDRKVAEIDNCCPNNNETTSRYYYFYISCRSQLFQLLDCFQLFRVTLGFCKDITFVTTVRKKYCMFPDQHSDKGKNEDSKSRGCEFKSSS